MTPSKPARQLANVAPLAPQLDAVSTARIGWLAGITPEGRPLVDFPGNPRGALPAMSTVAATAGELVAAAERRQPVVLLFDGGDPELPVIIGFVVPTVPSAQPRDLAEARDSGSPDVVEVDGKRICIEGKDEIVLRCGEASITLRRNGKVVLRGTYLEAHSKGTNRIKGGSVQIN